MKVNKYLIPYLLIYLFVFLLPISFLIYYSVNDNTNGLSILIEVFKSDTIRSVFFNTVYYSLLTTFISIIIGWILAYSIVFGHGRIKYFVSFIVFLPLLINPLILIYGIMLLLNDSGLINYILVHWFGFASPVQLLYTPSAVILGMVYLGIPYMTLAIVVSLLELKANIINAAKSMGASSLQIITRIILPVSLDGIYMGIFMVFVISLGYYIVPSILGGGNVDFISNIVEQNLNRLLNWPVASAISAWILLNIVIIFLILKRIMRSKYQLT